jgi:hypothetical protein
MSKSELEERIARLQLRIGQMRIYIAMLHPSQRDSAARLLRFAIVELVELTEQRDLHIQRQQALQTSAAA